MQHATAAWLVDNSALTFEQIATFCGLHILEVQAIADVRNHVVDVALAAAPPGLELEADVAIDIEGAAPFVRTVAALRNELHAAMKASIRADTGKTDEDADFTGQDNNALGLINQSLRDNATLKPPAGAPAGTTVAPPALGTPLVFEPAVTPQWAPQRAPPGASPSPTGIGAGA
jgi:hypothetical protein